MKKILLLFVLIITTNSYAQTIRRVTNLPITNPGVNTYATVNDAIAAATIGDVIYIEPSATAYAGFTVTKQLSFIGNGNFLDQNPSTPFEKMSSNISGNVTIEGGGTNSSIIGLYIYNSTVYVNGVNGVQIRRNRLNAHIVIGSNTSGTIITENFIDGAVRGNNGNTTAQQTVLKNNIIRGGYVTDLKNSIIQNNTIYVGTSGPIIYGNIDTDITNNIVDRRMVGSIRFIGTENTGGSVTNNIQISSSATLPNPNPDVNKNLYVTDANNIYVVNNPWTASPVTDAGFKLKSGSPAIGIGISGVDAGAFGGAFPYTLSGLPNIPIIMSAINSTTGTNSVPLSVTISVRSN